MSLDPVVALGNDTPELYSWVATRREHHPEVAGVLTEVATKQALAGVADAVLSGLGKDPWLTVSKRPAELAAASWLLAGDVTDVVVGYAQCISEWLAPILANWFVGCGVRPWFLYSTFDDDPLAASRAQALAADWGVEVVPLGEVLRRFPDTTRTERSVTEAPFPRVPRVDGMRFRSTVHDLCDPEDAKVIDELLTTTVTRMCTEVAAFGPKHQGRRFEEMLASHLDVCGDTEQAIVVVRAAQVAGVRTGFLVEVDTLRLVGGLSSLPRTGSAVAQRWWEGLDRYRDPDPGAAAGLYLAGVNPETLPELRLCDVTLPEAPGGPIIVSGPDGVVIVDGPAVRFVTALVHLRVLGGAEPSARLFATHRKDEVRTNHIAKLLWGTTIDTGVAVAPTPTHRRRPSAKDCLTRHGIVVTTDRELRR